MIDFSTGVSLNKENVMKWSKEADAAIKKVPFFVRKKVKARVESEISKEGRSAISLADVKAVQARYLANMGSEIKGYQLDTCFGPGGCPNRAHIGDGLLARLEKMLKQENLLEFLKQRVRGELRFHHEFRITLADCPNACSQPQIKDIGIIGASLPVITQEACTRCDACVDACREGAVVMDISNQRPDINFHRCLACGKCMDACPTGTLEAGDKGFRVLLGGKLGRHPQLAEELPGIFSEDEVIYIVRQCLAFYKEKSLRGERFAGVAKRFHFKPILPGRS